MNQRPENHENATVVPEVMTDQNREMKRDRFVFSKRRFQQIWYELSEMTTIKQVTQAISEPGLELMALGLLLIWCLSPIFMVIASIVNPQDDPFTILLELDLFSSNWATLLQILGNLGLIIGIIAGIKNHYEEGLFRPLLSKALVYCLSLMLIWSLFSTALAINPSLAFFGDPYRREGLLTYFAYAGIFSSAIMIKNKKRLRLLLASFGTGSLIVSIHYLVNWRPELYGSNYFGIFLQFNHTAYYFLFAIFINLTLYLTSGRERRLEQWLWLLAYCAAVSSLLINNSFGPFLAAVGGMILAITFRAKQALPDQKRRLIVAALIFLMISFVFNVMLKGVSRDTAIFVQDIAKITSGDATAETAGTGRWLLWTTGFELALERPLIGYGPDGLGQAMVEHGVTYNDRPHNEFIYFAASLGFPALLFYILGLIAHLRNFLVVRKELDWLVIGLFCTVGAYLVNSLFSNTMFYTYPFFVLFLGLTYAQVKYHQA
ncbi:MAG: O-antigen ligase family protein [Clostridia bacterium]|nr:O-antigen ligase family protein [Clostridia bacterium]